MPLLDGRSAEACDEAAERIAAGELVAFATETVYGLGARADDDAAVGRIYAAKGRPAGHPLIVHVADAQAARGFADPWPALAERLVAALWPGPLTVIVPRRAGVADAAAGGLPTIGLRCPAHPAAAALLRAAASLGVAGIAAPSANRYGRVSPTRAAHVQAEFAELRPKLAVFDGGDCPLGIESSIVDCSRGRPVLLRPGTLARERIEAAAGERLQEADAAAPRAPGSHAVHYAPRATLRLMSASALRTAFELWPSDAPAAGARRLAVYSRSVDVPRALTSRRMPDDPDAAAHQLFATLRRFDDDGVQLLWVETPPAGAEWAGVRDRLERAAAR